MTPTQAAPIARRPHTPPRRAASASSIGWRRRSAWCALPLLALGAAACPAQQLTPQRQREILRDALSACDEALAAAQDAQRAEESYRRAAAAFETLVDAGLRNPALEYNLGNLYMRLGDRGRAVLHYRRGQRLAPRHARLAANLEYARQRVEPLIAESGERRLLAGLLFWRDRTSAWERTWAAGGLSAAGWLLLLLRLRWRRGGLLAAGIACAACGLLCAATVAWELRIDARAPVAVVVAGRPVLRLGAGEGADPALREPLGPGVELRILRERGDWVEVRLRDGREGWLPAASLARV